MYKDFTTIAFVDNDVHHHQQLSLGKEICVNKNLIFLYLLCNYYMTGLMFEWIECKVLNCSVVV